MADPRGRIQEVIETLMGYAGGEDGDRDFEPFTFTQENADDMAYLADELTIALGELPAP